MAQRSFSPFVSHRRFRPYNYGFAIALVIMLGVITAQRFRPSVKAKVAFNTITVNTTADTMAADGFCSLREAIHAANTDTAVNECPAGAAGMDVIQFNLGAGTPKISLTSQLPGITAAVTIDGATGGATRVELDGSATGDSSGLTVSGGGSTIKSLVINGFTYFGIDLDSAGNTVQNCYIGTNAAGTAAIPNGFSGVFIFDANNTVGGTTAGTGNLISGNGSHGVELAGDLATGNLVVGNIIGLNAAGNATLGNTGYGVSIGDATGNTVGGTTAGARNIISGNSAGGLYIFSADIGAANNLVMGNYIGTDITGTADRGNLGDGVYLFSFSGFLVTGNVIGGTAAGAGNVISGNDQNGVRLTNPSATANFIQGNLIGLNAAGTAAIANSATGVALTASPGNTIGGTTAGARNVISGNGGAGININSGANTNTVQGNYIGTNAAGTAAISNGCGVCLLGGIYISASANNLIGGATAAARNVISGNNGDGIGVWEPTATGNQIYGNYIGVAADGVTALGNNANAGANTGGGVVFRNGASNNQIGGTSAGQGNVIANNTPFGVVMYSGTGNAIRGNSIYNNTGSNPGEGLGIDLGGDGITGNDVDDSDTGANNLQNFPVLLSALLNGTNTTFQGFLISTPNTTFRVELFSNGALDPPTGLEGKTFLGATNVMTNGGGNGSFSLTLPVNVAGLYVTSTATDPAGNTSEFGPRLCTYAIDKTSIGISSQGGNGSVNVTASAGCSWGAVSNDAWITINGPSGGNGNGTLNYSVAANAGTTPRTGTLSVAGYTFTVTQAATGVEIKTDFSGGIPPDWTVVHDGTGNYPAPDGSPATWTTANPCNRVIPAPFSSPFAIVDSACAVQPATQDEKLITAPFDATGLGRVILQFDNQFHWNPGGDNEVGDVDVSTDDGATWTNVLRLQGAEDGFPTPNTKTLDITAAVAANPSNVRVRFHYYTTAGPLSPRSPASQEMWWSVDNITVLNFLISPTSQNFGAAGDSGMINVTAGDGVPWLAESNDSWIVLAAGGGTGSGSIGYTVMPNAGPNTRTGTMTVARNTFTVVQTGACPAITVSPATLPNGFRGTVYNQTLTASGGTGPYSFTLSGGPLPDGLNLSSSGALSGTPTAAGTFSFTIKATDANTCFGTQSYTVIISGSGLQFYPLAHPVRLLDTRVGAAGCDHPDAAIPGGTSRTQPARGTCDGLTIPAGAQAITGNITTVQSGGGYLTLYPSDAAQPTVANSNYGPNEILNNVFTVGLGVADGAFKIFVTTNTDVVIDVTGYYAPPGTGGLYFHPLPKPIRLLETRAGGTGCTTPNAPLAGGVDTTQGAHLTCDGVTIPDTARAITGNATTVNPQGPGFPYLTLFPADATRPLVASSNYLPGQVMNAPFTVGLSAAGQFKIFPTTQTELVVDVLGYYSAEAVDANGAGLLFTPLPHPVRLLDTRNGATGCYAPNAALAAGSIRTQPARGLCDGVTVAADALGIVGNATVVNAAGGYLTFWPSSATQPLVATSNFTAGQVFNRHFTVGLGAGDGAFKIFTQFQTDLVVDVSGYFAP